MPPELDLDSEERKTSPLKIVLLVLAALILVGGSVGGTLYYTGFFNEDKKEQEEKKLEELKQTLYLPLEPQFIVNFNNEEAVSYLQVEMQLMSRNQYYIDQVVNNMPIIRHEILLILSGQTYNELRSAEGKEKLRETILKKIREIIGQGDKVPGIEAVFFSSFIMQ